MNRRNLFDDYNIIDLAFYLIFTQTKYYKRALENIPESM